MNYIYSYKICICMSMRRQDSHHCYLSTPPGLTKALTAILFFSAQKWCNQFFSRHQSAVRFSSLPSSHSFFSCGPGDKAGKDKGMFDGLLDSRRPDSTGPGDTPALSVICHPMQVLVVVMLSLKSY